MSGGNRNVSRLRLSRPRVTAYRVPTDAPEADGTYQWDSTTIVVVDVSAGGHQGLGYTYADCATARVVHDHLAEVVADRDPMAIGECWQQMKRAVRNLGSTGIAAMAISAVDVALWDLKSRLLDLPLVQLLSAVRDGVPVYGSGGFITYSDDRLQEQLAGWVADGIPRVKMKIGADGQRNLQRVRAARSAIGPEATLMVDANGALTGKSALSQAEALSELGVQWFEEPVSSDDLAGLRLLREHGPASMEITAGEYGYDAFYFRRMLEAGAVDVLQADATRCGGITGFLQAATLCEASCIPLSAHTAPALHLHACCAAQSVRHLEWFHDHVRLERMLFDGVQQPRAGVLYPDCSRPGIGLEIKQADAKKYVVDMHAN